MRSRTSAGCCARNAQRRSDHRRLAVASAALLLLAAAHLLLPTGAVVVSWSQAEPEAEAPSGAGVDNRELILKGAEHADNNTAKPRRLLSSRRQLATATCGSTAFTVPSTEDFRMECLGSGDDVDVVCSFNMGTSDSGNTCVVAPSPPASLDRGSHPFTLFWLPF
jgi:hypothetical protein